MNKIPKWVWLIVAAGGAWYLYSKYKTQTIALTGASVGTGGASQSLLPGTPNAVSTAASQIGSGVTQLFSSL